jgi:anaerobic glycerol-3-phosphate dehydrogenase
MTQQALHQHSYTIPLEWESRVPIVTTIRTIEVTRSHSADKPTSWVTSASRVTVLGCECGAEFRRQMLAQWQSVNATTQTIGIRGAEIRRDAASRIRSALLSSVEPAERVASRIE